MSSTLPDGPGAPGPDTTQPGDSPTGGATTAPQTGGRARLARGERVGRYLVHELIGSGGGGEVYEAHDATLDRKVALKVVPSTDADPARDQMLREARALARFAHPNVVAVHDVGEAGGRAWIAMELAQGERLEEWLRQPGLAWHDVVRVFAEAARGLAAVHRAGLVHRDFKPANVIVRSDGRVQLIDFGIARPDAGPARDARPLAVLVSGTPGYMAPEQMRGELPDARSDQFSFCAALWEALQGALPFGHSLDTAQLVRIERQEYARPAAALAAPAPVLAAVRKGLQYAPKDRYRSMDELARALGRNLPLDRRAWVGVVLVSLLAATTIAFLYLWSVRAPASCAGELRAATDLWRGDRRARLEATLHRGTLGAIDARAQELVDATREACTGPERLAERACLQRRRRELDVLLGSLGGGRLGVDQATLAVTSLPSPRDCLEVAAVASTDRLSACQRTLLDASGDWATGRWERAAARALDAQACARKLGDPALAATALRLEGAVAERTGDLATAERRYDAAAREALRAPGEPLAQAWAALARVQGLRRGDRDAASQLLDWAEAVPVPAASPGGARARVLLLRALLGPPVDGGAVDGAVARAAEAWGDDPSSADMRQATGAWAGPAALDRALEAFERAATGGDGPCGALLELADAALYWRAPPPAGARLLALAERRLPPGGTEATLARAWFAGVARELGAHAEALDLLRRLARDLEPTGPWVRAFVQLELSRAFSATGRPEDARVAAGRALQDASREPGLAWLAAQAKALAEPAPVPKNPRRR